jgi:hypothetical protein
MVVDRVRNGHSKLEISEALVEMVFDGATVYDGEVVTTSEKRSSEIATTASVCTPEQSDFRLPR